MNECQVLVHVLSLSSPKCIRDTKEALYSFSHIRLKRSFFLSTLGRSALVCERLCSCPGGQHGRIVYHHPLGKTGFGVINFGRLCRPYATVTQLPGLFVPAAALRPTLNSALALSRSLALARSLMVDGGGGG